ncbi:SoxR reducing system RseC family protein [Vibrio sp.]|uniref:Transcriptional regulator n=1 Tax=Vibrio viridaestus TaxID=2487322 RepID=A0A3N9U2N9_9VIBR|nr:SoxR reducing system RseC family protein [Vibrio viridaestus]MDC0610645.1 SoxR reducing system RseC family protein [Vibrio sp.]RQW63772.1 transcriptional regulator [Vibrio viridaestus]
MMTALATVTSVCSSSQGFKVELSCEQQSSCSHCSSSKSCGTGVVSKAIGNKVLKWTLQTTQIVKEGQMVEIGFPEKSLLQSAALVYLMPLIMLIIGAICGQSLAEHYFNNNELVVIAVSCLFAWSGIEVAKRLSKKLEKRSGEEVVLVRILGEPLMHSL